MSCRSYLARQVIAALVSVRRMLFHTLPIHVFLLVACLCGHSLPVCIPAINLAFPLLSAAQLGAARWFGDPFRVSQCSHQRQCASAGGLHVRVPHCRIVTRRPVGVEWECEQMCQQSTNSPARSLTGVLHSIASLVTHSLPPSQGSPRAVSVRSVFAGKVCRSSATADHSARFTCLFCGAAVHSFCVASSAHCSLPLATGQLMIQ